MEQQHNITEPLLTLKEAAEMLAISPRTLERYVQNREINFYRIGNGVRFRRVDISNFLGERYQPALK